MPKRHYTITTAQSPIAIIDHHWTLIIPLVSQLCNYATYCAGWSTYWGSSPRTNPWAQQWGSLMQRFWRSKLRNDKCHCLTKIVVVTGESLAILKCARSNFKGPYIFTLRPSFKASSLSFFEWSCCLRNCNAATFPKYGLGSIGTCNSCSEGCCSILGGACMHIDCAMTTPQWTEL